MKINRKVEGAGGREEERRKGRSGESFPPSRNAPRRSAQAAWNDLNTQIVACERCPRLRQYCLQVAAAKKAAHLHEDYWGRPAPNFGDPLGRILIVGLAPAAHGANRTGRLFTGDKSGDYLYRALHAVGLANQPTAVAIDDGLELRDCAITDVNHCAPPENKPTTEEIANCREWMTRTLEIIPVRVFVPLGGIAWTAVVRELKAFGYVSGKLPKFGHGAVADLADGKKLLGCYHPSQRNTFTGRLTHEMLVEIFRRAQRLAGPTRTVGK
ncbi:MAG: uracil-DNA glycosylase [Planctomycetaceae bacterium]|nr:uracil-DNA glycosylase [Planctomycetaceae bacterium]